MFVCTLKPEWKEETRIKSEVSQKSVIGSLLFLLFVIDLPSVIKMMTLLFADDIKMVSPRSQSGLLQSSLRNIWHRSVNWDLPINSIKCKSNFTGRAPPLQLSFATRSSGDSIQVANTFNDLGLLMDSSFPPSTHCREVASKATRMFFYDKAAVRWTIRVRVCLRS